MSMGKVLFIVNPAASGGQGKVAWDRFRGLWSDPIDAEDVRFTTGPGHASQIVGNAQDYEVVASVGGDGSFNEVMNGLMGGEGNRRRVAISPAGTGNDVARTLGLFPLDTAVEALRRGVANSFDCIRVDGREYDREFTRYAFMTGNLGFSSAPIIRPWSKRLLGATMAYYLNLFLAILAHKPPTMSIRWEGGGHEGRTWMVVVANVESVSGGSMRIAPGARPDDGLLWVTICEPKPKTTMIFKNLPKVAAGDHIRQEGFRYFSTQKIEFASDVRSIVDLDGEIEWATQATVRIVPDAMNILVPD